MERREKREEEILCMFCVVIRVNKCAVIVVADDAEAVATVVAQISVACIRYRPCSWELGRRTTTQKEREKREEGRQTTGEQPHRWQGVACDSRPRGVSPYTRTTLGLSTGRMLELKKEKDRREKQEERRGALGE